MGRPNGRDSGYDGPGEADTVPTSLTVLVVSGEEIGIGVVAMLAPTRTTSTAKTTKTVLRLLSREKDARGPNGRDHGIVQQC